MSASDLTRRMKEIVCNSQYNQYFPVRVLFQQNNAAVQLSLYALLRCQEFLPGCLNFIWENCSECVLVPYNIFFSFLFSYVGNTYSAVLPPSVQDSRACVPFRISYSGFTIFKHLHLVNLQYELDNISSLCSCSALFLKCFSWKHYTCCHSQEIGSSRILYIWCWVQH